MTIWVYFLFCFYALTVYVYVKTTHFSLYVVDLRLKICYDDHERKQNMNQQKIGEFLKQLRKDKGLTQEQLAEHFYVSSRTVSRWETGTNMPDIQTLIEIASFYDVDIREIIDSERKSENMNNETKDTLKKVAEYATEETGKRKKRTRIAFNIFSSLSIFLSVCVFELMRQLSGDPNTKMITSILVIFLLSVLNVAVLVLHEFLEEKKR